MVVVVVVAAGGMGIGLRSVAIGRLDRHESLVSDAFSLCRQARPLDRRQQQAGHEHTDQ